ncbi:hypothetical protein Tco_1463831, partial [Tanacetum coccineum]
MASVESPQMVSTVKLPILKKCEYTLWSMRMELYLTNTDYGLWQVIMNGDELVQTTKDDNGVETEIPPKTAQAILARQRERKAKSIPDEYQLRFHTIKDAKSLWAAIKKGLDKAYDRFQKLLSLLEVHEDTNSINEANTANGVSTVSGHSSPGQASLSSYTDDLMFLTFASQSNSPQLDDEDLEQIDHDDLEEMDLKWQVLTKPRLNALTVIEESILQRNVEHQEIKGTCMEMQDGLGYDWCYVAQDEPTKFALIAYTSGSDIEVQSCSKNYAKTYEKLQKQFDKQRQTLNKANLEIVAYQLGLESIEAQLIVHQRNEVVYEEKIAVLEFEVKDKGNAITRLTNQLDQNLREKEDLKTKLEQFETSSKNLNKLINSQLSAKDKTSLGYGDQLSKSDSEVPTSVFDSRSSDGDDNQANDRFKKSDGYHAVPPSLTGNYMPPLADLSFVGLDDSVYRPTTNKTSASISKGEASVTQTSNISVEMPKVDFVRTSGVLIKDWVIDDEDIFQSMDPQTTVKPSFKKSEFTKDRNEFVKS